MCAVHLEEQPRIPRFPSDYKSGANPGVCGEQMKGNLRRVKAPERTGQTVAGKTAGANQLRQNVRKNGVEAVLPKSSGSNPDGPSQSRGTLETDPGASLSSAQKAEERPAVQAE